MDGKWRMKYRACLPKEIAWKKLAHRLGRSLTGLHPGPQLLLAALLLALALGSPSQTPAAQAAFTLPQNVPLSWRVITYPTGTITLCTGEFELIRVKIMRIGATGQFISGGTVWGVSNDTNIADLLPSSGMRDIAGVPPAALGIFTVVGNKPGRTTIEFGAIRTGDEGFYGGATPAEDSPPIHVEVTDCYEATTSGLGAIFTTKDICSLDEPFLLAAYTPNTNNITEETQVLFFMPYPQDSSHGSYAFVDNATAYGEGCILYSSGTYEVLFYIPTAGDLIMKGSGTMVCRGGGTNVPKTQFRVAFTAATDPFACAP